MSEATWVVESRRARGLQWAADFVELTKPRICTLVLVVVSVAGYLAGDGLRSGWTVLHAVFGTLLVAASASAMNQYLERRRDAVMARTAQRPLPAQRLHPVPVLNFIAVSLAVGMSQLFLSVSPLAAGWAGASWLIYVVVYTPLKMRTEWNTAVGAVAGALPALIGWSAVGGSFDPAADPRGLVLFFVLFLWQFPHFMAIAWIYRQQYRQAGMQMMTVTDPSGARAAAQAVAAALGVLAVSLIPSWFLPWPAAVSYAVAAALLGAAQVACAVGFFRRRTDAAARRMLRATLLYLPLWLTALVLHAG